jgi:hypothetical protein
MRPTGTEQTLYSVNEKEVAQWANPRGFMSLNIRSRGQNPSWFYSRSLSFQITLFQIMRSTSRIYTPIFLMRLSFKQASPPTSSLDGTWELLAGGQGGEFRQKWIFFIAASLGIFYSTCTVHIFCPRFTPLYNVIINLVWAEFYKVNKLCSLIQKKVEDLKEYRVERNFF